MVQVDEPLVLTSNDDAGVMTLTLNRPQQFNALSLALLEALEDALAACAADPAVRVVVIAGAGKAFCAGHDLAEMKTHGDDHAFQLHLFETCARVMLAIRDMPQPVIARVHGVATAAGCQLVAACDLSIAVDSARFAVSGIKAGLFCSTPSVALTRAIPMKAAMDMLLTGDFISASEAVRLGLLNKAVIADELDAAVRDLADRIIANSAYSLKLGKELAYAQAELPLEDAYALAANVMADNMMCADAKEGIAAFTEKRKPVFTHR